MLYETNNGLNMQNKVIFDNKFYSPRCLSYIMNSVKTLNCRLRKKFYLMIYPYHKFCTINMKKMLVNVGISFISGIQVTSSKIGILITLYWHYLEAEIPELLQYKEIHKNNDNETFIICEMGCGVGNTLFPLKSNYPFFKKVYGFDFSKKAIEVIENSEHYKADEF